MFKSNLSQRQNNLLHYLIEEYIYTARPVPSSSLAKKYDLQVSSATIRNDFQVLTKQGYLYKKYSSSGRIPTDKAWKFFVNRIFQENTVPFRKRKEKDAWLTVYRNIFRDRNRLVSSIEQLLNSLVRENHSFYFCYLREQDELIKRGVEYIFQEMAEEKLLSLDFIQLIIESLNCLNERLKHLKITNVPSVFIGRDNPLVKSDQFSSLITPLHSHSVILGMLAPKRMPYRKNIFLLKKISNLFS